eukprot:GDKJ01010863.1.p2 GENE.GDKJ01010863.1~~GDKJ01010863.1.p2  ORF type:complete len:184 (-),score=23.38 GDKJ01010863.1:2175-2726(-)
MFSILRMEIHFLVLCFVLSLTRIRRRRLIYPFAHHTPFQSIFSPSLRECTDFKSTHFNDCQILQLIKAFDSIMHFKKNNNLLRSESSSLQCGLFSAFFRPTLPSQSKRRKRRSTRQERSLSQKVNKSDGKHFASLLHFEFSSVSLAIFNSPEAKSDILTAAFDSHKSRIQIPLLNTNETRDTQ